jgi:hypothetical protein
MDTPVVFNYTNWALRYPELAGSVSDPLAEIYFGEAQLYCDNSPTSIISNCAPAYQRTYFLNMITAHIASLNASINGQPPNPLVGRISNATEGSVNVTTQFDMSPGSAQWFAQTKYGAAFWQASAAYRTMHYIPGPPGPRVPYGYPR